MISLVGIVIILIQLCIMRSIFQTGILTNNNIKDCNIRSTCFCIFLYTILISVLSFSAIIIKIGGTDTDIIFDALKGIFFCSALLFSVLANVTIKTLAKAVQNIDGSRRADNKSGDDMRGDRISWINRWFVRFPL